jgi:Fur family transcriptional regulator, peroxide stress response regulator
LQSTESIIQSFYQKGLKITPQRRHIVELLENDESHPTAEELYQRVILLMPDVSQTTIYNTIRELVALGELTPVDSLSETGIRFDTNTNDHHHLFCNECHNLVDIERNFPEIELAPEEIKEYQIIKNQITFYGICKECQEN